jgi:hypothetical protein
MACADLVLIVTFTRSRLTRPVQTQGSSTRTIDPPPGGGGPRGGGGRGSGGGGGRQHEQRTKRRSSEDSCPASLRRSRHPGGTLARGPATTRRPLEGLPAKPRRPPGEIRSQQEKTGECKNCVKRTRKGLTGTACSSRSTLSRTAQRRRGGLARAPCLGPLPERRLTRCNRDCGAGPRPR